MDRLIAFARLWRVFLVALVVVAPLSACNTLKNVSGPPPAFDIDKDINQYATKYGAATSVSTYYDDKADSRDRRVKRDEFIVGRLTLYNLQYIKFIQGFAIDRAQAQSAFDITNLTLGVANSLVGGQADHAALTAATTLLNGSRLAIDKNFFAEQTVPALVTQMNASRQAALVPILQGMQDDETRYPLGQALVDLQKYYEAGTIQGALMDVQVAAGAKKAAADRQIDALRSQPFAEDKNTVRLAQWLYPGRVKDNDRGQAIDASGGLVPMLTASRDSLRSWLDRNGWVGVPFATLLYGKNMADAREQAVANLAVP